MSFSRDSCAGRNCISLESARLRGLCDRQRCALFTLRRRSYEGTSLAGVDRRVLAAVALLRGVHCAAELVSGVSERKSVTRIFFSYSPSPPPLAVRKVFFSTPTDLGRTRVGCAANSRRLARASRARCAAGSRSAKRSCRRPSDILCSRRLLRLCVRARARARVSLSLSSSRGLSSL